MSLSPGIRPSRVRQLRKKGAGTSYKTTKRLSGRGMLFSRPPAGFFNCL